MGLNSSFGAPVLVCVLLLFSASSPFLQKKETVCHSGSDCGSEVRLTCNGTRERLAVLDVSRAYHLNISKFDQCASSVQNCSETFNSCCRPAVTALVCNEDYSTEFLEEVLSNCSAQLSPSGQESNATGCVLDLPSDPQPSVERCAQLSSYHKLSSYSTVDYACIPESDVVQLCEASTRRGNLLYAFWTPTDSHPSLSDANATSCRCSITTAGSPAEVFVRALDVRIPRSDAPEECSNVTVTDSVRTRLKTSCANRTTILFGMTSQFTGLTLRPPVDVILTVHPKSEPEIVWLGFQGLDSRELILTCFNAGQNLSRETTGRPTNEPVDTSKDSLPVPAVIGGVVAGVVLLLILAFVCFHFLSKRKSRSFKRQNAGSSWWERTREEDRLAEMSQLGPASSVILDRGHHMAYGRRPPTRRSYPTSETNPPIHIVSGNAIPRRDSHSYSDFVGDSRKNSESRAHPGASGAGGAAAAPAVPSTMGWRLGEPSVTYTNVPQQDSEAGRQPVAIVNDGYKVRIYEVPPLTIKEIE